MSETTDRLDALEAKLLTVADLPLAALQRKLEQNWQPDASVLLQPGSITAEMLASAINIGTAPIAVRFGSITLAFTASASSATLAVTHGLGRAPIGVLFGNADLNIDNVAATLLTTTSFTAQARYASSVTGNVTITWFAIG